MHSVLLCRLIPAAAVLFVLALNVPASAAIQAGHDPTDPYREVRIPWSALEVHRPVLLELELELMSIAPDASVTALCRSAELERLAAAGVPHEIVVDDLEAFYAARSSGDNFGIFHTYSETVAFLDQLHADYPMITTDKIQIGVTWEGRTIWGMKISDNPELPEADEPEVLFDAVHHAREVITVEVLIDYMQWLCSSYGVDDEATWLVDHRQTWFVPIVNPDGFVYNETTNPNGGGMWRKNRRNDLGACVGVDPNRNYPYEWGGAGASTNPCDETYRGPAAASEPEVASMIGFMNQHAFVTQNSYHSVVGVVLFPWAYTTEAAPDDATFRALAGEMSRENGYPYGTVFEMLSYPASGGAFDWSYGEQVTKPKIFAFSTEVGGSGFWPAESERAGLVAEQLYSNIVLTRAAGVYLVASDFAVVGGDLNGRLDPGETVDLVTTIANQGVAAEATGVTLTLTSDDPYLSLSDASGFVGTVPAIGSADHGGDPFTLSASAETPAGHRALLTVAIADGAGFTNTSTLGLVIGQAPILYASDFEGGSGGWELDPSHTASTGDFVRIDPNPTEYQPGDDTTPPPGVHAWVTAQNTSLGVDDVDDGVSATRSPILDLSATGSAELSLSWFHGQRDPGNDSGDFFRIDLSNDGGATYPANLVSIGDVGHAASWRQLAVALDDYLPLTDQMRIRVQAADGPATGDIVEAGIDDVVIFAAGSGNEPPGPPALLAPPDGATGLPATPILEVLNAVDPEGDPLTYTFQVYADPLLTTVIAEAEGVPEGAAGSTSWTVAPPLAAGTYSWRAHAADAEERGLYMPAASFEVSGTVAVASSAPAPPGPQLRAPSPNPFSAGTIVSYALSSRSRVRLDVFDVSGRHVRRLIEGVVDAGQHRQPWDGLGSDGARAAAGVYLVQLEVDGIRQTQKLIRLP